MNGWTPVRLAALSIAVLACALAVPARPGDFADGTWSSLEGLPPRYSFAIGYDAPRERCVVFGGLSSGGSALGDVWALDLRQDAWSSLYLPGSAPSGRSNCASALDTLRHRLVVFGGFTAGGLASDVWALTLDDPAHWDSIPAAGGPGPRYSAIAVYDPVRDRIVLFGGFDALNNPYSDLWELRTDPTPTWTPLSPTGNAPIPTSGASGIYDPVRDRILYCMPGDTTQVFALDLTDPPVWHVLATAGVSPSPRTGDPIIYDPTQDRLLIHGGILTLGGGYTDDTWALSLAGTPTWSRIAHITSLSGAGRAFGGGVYDPIGRAFVLTGGLYFNGDPPARQTANTYSLSMPPASTWQLIVPQPNHATRSSMAAAYDPSRHQLLLVLGSDAHTGALDVLDLSGARPVWSDLAFTSTPPVTLIGSSGVYDVARDRMLVFGGQNGLSYLSTVWVYDRAGPLAWSTLATSGGPPAGRCNASMVLDVPNDRLIVYGGRDGNNTYDDVWQLSLDASPTWTQLAANVPAGTRYGHSAVVDALNSRMVVFGGRTSVGNPTRNDVWAMSLSGSPDWAQLTPTGGPPVAREMHSAVYDDVRHRMIVYGGEARGVPFGDLWSLSLGAVPAWTALSPAGTTPPARYSQAAVWAPEFAAMVVADGYNNGWLSDSWKLDAFSLVAVPEPRTPEAVTALEPARPNPARGSAMLSYTLSRAADTRLEVFDLAGRRVRVLASGTMTAGPHEARWDLRDESGHAVPSGVYLARLSAPGASGVRRFVVLR